jgi:hypothetical protein
VTRWMVVLLLAGAVTSGCERGPAREPSSQPARQVDPADTAAQDDEGAGADRSAQAKPRAVPSARPAGAPDARPAPPPAPPAPTVREVTLPAGTTLRLVLESGVASDSSAVEDTVRATLGRAVSADGSPVLPEGTEVTGVVTDVDRSGRVKGRAHLAFRFTSLRYDGQRYDIRTDTVSRTAEATKGEDATKIAVGAGAGAALGAVLGGKSGAAKGAAVGGAGGTGVVLATRGKEVRLGPGTAVTTKLTAPLVVRVPTS